MVRVQCVAGKATPAPPVGPALGQHGINIMDFCKQFNSKTGNKDLEGMVIPAVITVHDIFDHTVSRFGVGLPQFSERRSERGSEVLQVGSLRRVLMHHDFELTTFGIPIGEGSVHVVNPADPGATAYADVYRDFFEPSLDETASGLHAQREPVVYERSGNVHGTPSFRLPQSPSWYFAALKPGQGTWVEGAERGAPCHVA